MALSNSSPTSEAATEEKVVIKNEQQLYANIPRQNQTKESAEFSLLAEEINRQSALGKIVVGIFKDDIFSGEEVPCGLVYQNFLETWGQHQNVYIVPLNANQIRSYSITADAKIDILVFPYGSIYPMDAYRFYSALSFNHFIEKGGCVLTTGGIPFMKQAANNGNVMPIGTPDEMISVYDKWVSKFGVKYYPCALSADAEIINEDFLPSLAGVDISPAKYGIALNNSSHFPVPKPPHGNVFPERYPVKQIIPLSWGAERYGEHTATTGILAQDYETGSVRMHFSHEGRKHPLSPSNECFGQTMEEIFTLLTNKIFSGELESEYACYRQGETVNIKSQIISFERSDTDVQIQLTIKAGENAVVFDSAKSLKIPKGINVLEWQFDPGLFKHDEYIMTLTVLRDGRAVSRAENGFIAWLDQTVETIEPVAIKDEYFFIYGSGSFITGTNYYESMRGEIMWYRPDVRNVIKDLRQMAECGVNMIRPHYHHLKWFRDYLKYHHSTLFPFFSDLETVNDYMPDERAWRIFDMFIYLCHKYKIIFNGDLFTLVPLEMGDPRGWYGTVEAVLDSNKRGKQKRFLEELERRYSGLPFIAWDLFNEPYMFSSEDIDSWASDLKAVVMAITPDRLLCVGGPPSLGAELDFDCPHGSLADSYINKKGKPLLLQELHLDVPEPLEHEISQGESLRHNAVSAIHSGTAGICPWSWTRQMRLWQDVYEHHYSFPMEKWDDRLGTHTHCDGTLKVAGRIFRDIAIMMKSVNLTSYDSDKQLSFTDRGTLIGILGTEERKDAIYHYSGDKCFAAMDMTEIKLGDKTLLSSNNEAYLFFFTETHSFDDSPVLYFKAEAAGKYRLHRSGITDIRLVKFIPEGVKTMDKIECETGTNFSDVMIDTAMTNYWLKVTCVTE